MRKFAKPLVVLTVAVVGLLVFASGRRPPVDLRFLHALGPRRRDSGTWILRQDVDTLKRALDERLNASTGWDSEGYAPAGFYWYRPDDWERPLPRLLSDVGLGGAELRIETLESGGTEVTIYPAGDLVWP